MTETKFTPDANGWNFDISQAPKGQYSEAKLLVGPKGRERLVRAYHHVKIIAAGNEGVVTASRWLPDEGRWECFTKEVPPLAWQLWPKHPLADRSKSQEPSS